MNETKGDRIASRALASLRAEGPAAPSADLAQRAASRALSASPPTALDDLIGAVLTLVRPAAALGCAAALVLGVAHFGTRGEGAQTADASASSLELLSADDALSAVLPFSVTSSGGAG